MCLGKLQKTTQLIATNQCSNLGIAVKGIVQGWVRGVGPKFTGYCFNQTREKNAVTVHSTVRRWVSDRPVGLGRTVGRLPCCMRRATESGSTMSGF